MSVQSHATAFLSRLSACTMFFLTGLLISACGGGSDTQQSEIIAIIPHTASVSLGQTVQFRATGYMNNGQTQDLTSSVSWQSSNTGIATVSPSGLATSVTPGTINMTASWNGHSSTASLVVAKAALETLTITPPSASVVLGQAAQLTAIGTFSDKTTQDLTSVADWSSAQPAVATVNTAGLATSKAVGNTTVTASVGSITASNQLAVSPAALSAIVVGSAAAATPLGTKEQFTAQGVYTDGSKVDITNQVTWTSTPSGIVAIGTNGLAATHAVGNVTVTAVSAGVTGTGSFTVSPAALVSIAVQGTSATVPLGVNAQFTATGTYTDGSTSDITSTASWTGLPAGIVNVAPNGLAASKAAGTATITATASGISGSNKLTVTSATLVSIAVHSPSAALPLGTNGQLGATGTYTDGSTADLTSTATWTSSPAGIVAVSSAGAVSTKAVGNAAVTATSAGKSGSGKVAVSSAALVSIQVSSSRSSLPLGSTQQLNATGVYTDSSTQNLTGAVQWVSASPDVVGVSNAGLATAKAQGATNVLASSGAVTGATGLNVAAAELTSIGISPAAPTVPLGSNLQLSSLGSFTDGSSQDVTSQITWSVDRPDIAVITPGGMITGLQVGSAVVTASLNGVQASATITVQPLAIVGYFDATSGVDTTLRITNPAITGQDLCAMIYVFDNDQQLSECCGCLVSQNGLRTLSLNNNLLNNPLTGVQSKSGTVMVVSADYASNLSCNASAMTPTGAQIAWSTHLLKSSTGQTVSTEDTFSASPLNATLSSSLQAQCSFVQTLGSGQGICSCGTGD
ncbi:Ig-like domain-containing protein [Alloacidobacterium dinghuense]|uniref:Ig-like domain-containing protein n=1 Tax=Alloacidobacterium dinghuense TaxID=2763107 RepID=A0A7G8BEE9_9BACT|nr:Ig-like domain-containing protein [Alloacidobacterium dinghuense]QNI30919.1 Ig-like domain-containing protein [Alloacidobacterium dinghuense]